MLIWTRPLNRSAGTNAGEAVWLLQAPLFLLGKICSCLQSDGEAPRSCAMDVSHHVVGRQRFWVHADLSYRPCYWLRLIVRIFHG